MVMSPLCTRATLVAAGDYCGTREMGDFNEEACNRGGGAGRGHGCSQGAVAADDGLSSRTSGVTYWLDRTYPGPYVGGMVVVRQGKRYFAAARFFEGRAVPGRQAIRCQSQDARGV